MKILLGSLALGLSFAACDPDSEASTEKSTPSRQSDNKTKPNASLSSHINAMKQDPKNFNIKVGKLHLTAAIDGEGNVRILDYPPEWHAKATLVRVFGQAEAPFSQEYCQTIRGSAESGFGRESVRSAYHSELIFEVAPFLSEDFVGEVEKAAKAAGFDLPIIIRNPVDIAMGIFEMSLSENAISHIIGSVERLEDRLNLSYRGVIKNLSEQEVTITAADIICDLISGAARFSMTYQTEGEGQVIKVIYDPMEVKIRPR